MAEEHSGVGRTDETVRRPASGRHVREARAGWSKKGVGNPLSCARNVHDGCRVFQYLTKTLEVFERLGTLVEPDNLRKELADLPQ